MSKSKFNTAWIVLIYSQKQIMLKWVHVLSLFSVSICCTDSFKSLLPWSEITSNIHFSESPYITSSTSCFRPIIFIIDFENVYYLFHQHRTFGYLLKTKLSSYFLHAYGKNRWMLTLYYWNGVDWLSLNFNWP